MRRWNIYRKLILVGLQGWLWLSAAPPACAEPPVVLQFQSDDRVITGLQLVHEPHRTVLLGRDGWLYDSLQQPQVTFSPSVEARFTAVSALELRSRLQAEFGHAFEVVATQNYLVVQPAGRGQQWPTSFERMYRRFVTYMEQRGVTIRQGRFPLVAIVMPDEVAMRDTFDRMRIAAGRVAGIYDLSSNRVLLHDTGDADNTAETVRHEAAHQTAYNAGVHSRISDTPRWLVEGVGSLFEPAAMEEVRHSTLGERVNRDLLHRFLARYADSRELADAVRRLVADDECFANEQTDAYALGWAMTFYLAERQPRQFSAILKHTHQLPPFERYRQSSRLRDFETIVDAEIPRFVRQMERFLAAF